MDIFQEIDRLVKRHGTINVVIAGQSCSGKTTLAKNIAEHFRNIYPICMICQDDYFKNLCDIPRAYEGYLMEVHDAFCIRELRQDVSFLLKYGNAKIPNYDIATNTRINKNKVVYSGKINIFEGLHTIDIFQDFKPNITIFVNTDPATCLERRIIRDTKNLGVPEWRVREYWNECIQPMSERFIFPQKDFADIVLKGE